MKIIHTRFEGLKIIIPKVLEDARGEFIKTFNSDFFLEHNISLEIKEIFYSLSNKDVIRGMHFQTPPHEHTKLIYVAHGKILDVVLDIRKDSPTYGEFYSIELSKENTKILLIPKGFAHGYKSLQDNTNVTYMQSSCYEPNSDTGIKYDSFGFEWDLENPILSKRDLSFIDFNSYKTPFKFEQML